MKLFRNAFLNQSIQNQNSYWYHNGKIYHLGHDETHASWMSKHSRAFGFDVPDVGIYEDGSVDWLKLMNIAFAHGFIRVQVFNDIATISVLQLNQSTKVRIFKMLYEYYNLFKSYKYIEVMTLEHELSQFEDTWDELDEGEYMNAESVQELMEKLG